MTVILAPLAKQQFNQNGVPLAGGKLFVYNAGTTTKTLTYTDGTGDTPNTNPIILDSNGQCGIWLLTTGSYKFVLSPANDTDPPTNPFWTVDNVATGQGAAVGNMTDELGSGGTAGFAASVDFTPGTTTQLTLSQNYGSSSNLWVAFDDAEQGADQFSLGGTGNTTLTFTAAIPVGVNKVYVKGGTALTIGTPGNGTVFDAQVATGAAIQSSKISFLSTLSGAVAYSLQAKLSQIVSVKDFGAKGDGTTDDTAAIQAAITAVEVNGGSVYFPPGKYKTTSTLTISNGFIRLFGPGKQIATIAANFASGDTLVIGSPTSALQSVYVQGLAFIPSVTKTAGNEINIEGNNINVFVDDCIFTGGFAHIWMNSYGAASSYWVTNSYFQNAAGSSIIVGGANGFMQDAWVLNAEMGLNSTHIQTIWASGFYYKNIDALEASDTAFSFNPPSGKEVIAGWLDTVLADTCAGAAFDFSTKGGNMGSILMHNCWATGAPTGSGASGLVIIDDATSGGAINGIDIQGGVVQSGAQNGVYCNGGSNIILNGVNIWNNGRLSSGAYAGCFVNSPDVSNLIVTKCKSGYGGTPYLTGGTQVQGYGLQCASGTLNGLVIEGNNFANNLTAPFQNLSTGSNQKVTNNFPNPAVTQPAVPASTATITNPQGRDARLFIYGGAFTVVTLNGSPLGISGNVFNTIIRAGETIAITYSSAPVWEWVDF